MGVWWSMPVVWWAGRRSWGRESWAPLGGEQVLATVRVKRGAGRVMAHA